jgi:hypothetical protein
MNVLCSKRRWIQSFLWHWWHTIHQIQRVAMAPMQYLLIIICYLSINVAVQVKTMPQLHQVRMYRWNRYSLHKTSYKTVHSQHRLPPAVSGRILNLYDFKRSKFLATRTNVLDTPVSCDYSLKDVRGDVCNRTPLSSNVYSKRKRRVCYRFLVKIEPIFERFLPFAILLIYKNKN